MATAPLPPLAPFTEESARAKVKAAQALWNTRDPHRVAQAYTPSSVWRNRDVFLTGRSTITAFLTDKWAKETHYVLRKELFAFTGFKIAVQFWYEYQDAGTGEWRRVYGLEDWTYDDGGDVEGKAGLEGVESDDRRGKMRKRMMSANEVVINEGERWFRDGMSAGEIDAVEITEKHW